MGGNSDCAYCAAEFEGTGKSCHTVGQNQISNRSCEYNGG